MVDSWGQGMLKPLVAYSTLRPFGFIYPFLPQSSLIVNVPSVVFASGVHIRGSRGCTGVASATVACGACPWRRRRNEKHRKRYHHHEQQDGG